MAVCNQVVKKIIYKCFVLTAEQHPQPLNCVLPNSFIRVVNHYFAVIYFHGLKLSCSNTPMPKSFIQQCFCHVESINVTQTYNQQGNITIVKQRRKSTMPTKKEAGVKTPAENRTPNNY
jgi:hypothetical protein